MLESILDRCREGGDGSDCFREGPATRVRLWGTLPPGWAGHLALHACALGLEIVSGDAIRIDTRWAATFLVRTADARAGAIRHDFLRMARRAPRVVPPLPQPEVEIALEIASDASCGLVARVTGKDTIGLLADVLRRFDAWELCPREFSLRTERGEVEDWFWLERVRAD